MQQRRTERDGTNNVIDGLLDYRFEDRPLTDNEIALQLVCALLGGIETLPKVVAHGLWELRKNPYQLAEVRTDLVNNCATAFDEMTRFCGFAQYFTRTVRVESAIAGTVVRPGQRLFLLIQSAARVPREFDDPTHSDGIATPPERLPLDAERTSVSVSTSRSSKDESSLKSSYDVWMTTKSMRRTRYDHPRTFNGAGTRCP